MVSINLVRAGARCMLAASFVVVATLSAAAQGITVSGRLLHSVTLKPVAGATVLVEGTTLETTSSADGTYSIANVPALLCAYSVDVLAARSDHDASDASTRERVIVFAS